MEVARGRVELQWRNYFLIERGKFPNSLLNPKPNIKRNEFINDVCSNPLFANPGNDRCDAKQRHYCTGDATTGWSIHKCSRDLNGKKLNNGECCCHGCLKRHKRKVGCHSTDFKKNLEKMFHEVILRDFLKFYFATYLEKLKSGRNIPRRNCTRFFEISF